MGVVEAPRALLLQQAAVNRLYPMVGNTYLGRYSIRGQIFLPHSGRGPFVGSRQLHGAGAECASRILARLIVAATPLLAVGSIHDHRPAIGFFLDLGDVKRLAGSAKLLDPTVGSDWAMDGAWISKQVHGPLPVSLLGRFLWLVQTGKGAAETSWSLFGTWDHLGLHHARVDLERRAQLDNPNHMASRSGLDQSWRLTLRFFTDFLLSETLLLNPVFFIGAVLASVCFWRHSPDRLQIYLFSMGAPVFFGYLLYTFRAKAQPNWIAPAIIPLFCLMAIYWSSRWREGLRIVKYGLTTGLLIGLPAVVLLHETNLIDKVVGRPLPPAMDPLRRVRAWKEAAQVVGEARTKLLEEGKPVFIIGDHYGITGLLSFYLPEAKVGVRDNPIVFARSADKAENQFFFWPSYGSRTGQNAIYVAENSRSAPAPEQLERSFRPSPIWARRTFFIEVGFSTS